VVAAWLAAAMAEKASDQTIKKTSLCWLPESSVGFLIVKHAEVVTKMEYYAVLS